MAKITEMQPLADEDIDGSEHVPVVKGTQTRTARLGALFAGAEGLLDEIRKLDVWQALVDTLRGELSVNGRVSADRKHLDGFDRSGAITLNRVAFVSDLKKYTDAEGWLQLLGPEGDPLAYLAWHIGTADGAVKGTGQVQIGALADHSVRQVFSRAAALGLGSGSGLAETAPSPVIRARLSSGQSLDKGGSGPRETVARVSTTQTSPFAWMPNVGLRMRYNNALSVANLSSLVPLLETEDTIGNFGETQNGGKAAQAYLQMIAAGDFRDQVYFTCAEGGTALAGITAGTRPFDNGVTFLTWLIDFAAARGRSVDFPTHGFTHGEEDRVIGTAEADYYNGMIAYRAALNAALLPLLRAQPGQSAHPEIAIGMWQLAAPPEGDETASQIAIAQYRLARDFPADFYLRGPSYQFDFIPTADFASSVHREGYAYAQQGELAEHADRLFESAGSYSPMMPTAIVRESGPNGFDTRITLTFTNATGDLVIDTDARAAAPDFGIEATGAAITGVSVSGNSLHVDLDSTAQVTLRSAFTPAGGTVGKASAWTNIRDSAAIRSALQPTEFFRHWLPVIEETIA